MKEALQGACVTPVNNSNMIWIFSIYKGRQGVEYRGFKDPLKP